MFIYWSAIQLLPEKKSTLAVNFLLVFQIHGEGLITLGKETFVNTALRHRKFPFPPNTPSIAVFYAPIQIYDNSEVFYRETRNQDDLERATNYARSSFVEDTTFSASHVFIATWNNVTRASTIFPNKVTFKEQMEGKGGVHNFSFLE